MEVSGQINAEVALLEGKDTSLQMKLVTAEEIKFLTPTGIEPKPSTS
jgi:hypothetical protein